MICFELFINNKRISRAGIPGNAVLSTILTWANHQPRSGAGAPDSFLNVDLSGLDSNGPEWEQGTHVKWVSRKLEAGDTIKVRILDADRADPPVDSCPSANKAQLDAMEKKSRRYYLALYRRQRRELDKQIKRLEEASNKATPKVTRPRRKTAKVRSSR